MKIVRIAHNDLTNDVYCVVVLPDHDEGMPEGLARWNGAKWSWVDRQIARTLALDFVNGKLITLDFSGHVQILDGDHFASLVHGPDGCNDMCVQDQDVFIVALNGQFRRFNNNRWESINHSHTNHLFSVSAGNGNIYACGLGGIILKYKDGVCHKVDKCPDFDLNSIWANEDGTVFAAGGSGENGYLVEITHNKIISTPSRLFFLKGSSQSELIGVDWDGVTWFWDGSRLSRHPVSDNFLAYCTSRSGKGLALGGEDSVAFMRNNKYDLLPLSLDTSFLE